MCRFLKESAVPAHHINYFMTYSEPKPAVDFHAVKYTGRPLDLHPFAYAVEPARVRTMQNFRINGDGKEVVTRNRFKDP